MVVYCNFREILGVFPADPSFTCVGTTQQGHRCGQWMISEGSKQQAGELLDFMDSCKNPKSSYDDLDELARLTLCPRWHNKPDHRNQVVAVSSRWRRVIAQYERMEQDKPKAANRKARSQSEKSKQKANVYKDEQEENKNRPAITAPKSTILKQRDTNLPLANRRSAPKAVGDPFTSGIEASSSRRVIVPSSLSSSSSSSAWPELKMSIPTVSSSRSEEADVAKEKKEKVPAISLLNFSLSMPPETPGASQETEQEVLMGVQATPTKSSVDKAVKRQPVTFSNNTTTSITSTAQSTTSAIILTASPETPLKSAQITTTTTSLSYEAETFGYANGTPETTSYKTYLPAQKNHGLITPPETPETLPRVGINSGPINDSFPGFSVRPIAIRKTLPDARNENVVVEPVCSTCREGRCCCEEILVEEEEEEVKAGCLRGLGLGRLKRKVVRKMKNLRKRMSKKRGSDEKS